MDPKIFLLNTQKCGLQFGFRLCTIYISQADNSTHILCYRFRSALSILYADNIRKSRHIFSNTHAYANSQKHTLHICFLLLADVANVTVTYLPTSFVIRHITSLAVALDIRNTTSWQSTQISSNMKKLANNNAWLMRQTTCSQVLLFVRETWPNDKLEETPSRLNLTYS